MRKLTTLLAWLVLSISLQAQSNSIQHMDVFVQTQFIQRDSSNGNDTLHLSEAFKEPQMFVVLADTNDVTAFSVKLGTTSGSGDILDKSFSFSEEGQFQDGTSYTRDGNYVRLNLGRYATLPAYYAQVKATVGGNQQSAFTFSGQ